MGGYVVVLLNNVATCLYFVAMKRLLASEGKLLELHLLLYAAALMNIRRAALLGFFTIALYYFSFHLHV